MGTALSRLRFALNKQGHDVAGFHANLDPKPRRELVLEVISADPSWNYSAVVVEKRKVHPSLYEPRDFYPKFASMPLHLVLKYRVRPNTNQVVLYTGLMPVSGMPRKHMEATVKFACRSYLAEHIPIQTFHHSNFSNYWLQVADYCAWAVQRKWESGDQIVYDKIKTHLVAPELDVLRRGKTYYY